MSIIIQILAVSLLCILVVMAASVWLMNWAVKTYIGRKHRLLEEIIRTEQVPKSWLQKVGKSQAASAQAMKRYCKKLDKLADYVKSTSLVADEETRRTLLESLQLVRTKWGGSGEHGQHTLRQ